MSNGESRCNYASKGKVLLKSPTFFAKLPHEHLLILYDVSQDTSLWLFFLTLYFILKNGQTYLKNLAVWTPQGFWSMFGYFSTLWNKRLIIFKQTFLFATPSFLTAADSLTCNATICWCNFAENYESPVHLMFLLNWNPLTPGVH